MRPSKFVLSVLELTLWDKEPTIYTRSWISKLMYKDEQN